MKDVKIIPKEEFDPILHLIYSAKQKAEYKHHNY